MGGGVPGGAGVAGDGLGVGWTGGLSPETMTARNMVISRMTIDAVMATLYLGCGRRVVSVLSPPGLKE